MNFIFGYSREVPVKIERQTPKLALVGLAILIVVLFIFLTFEDIDDQISVSNLVFNAPPNSPQVANADNSSEIDSESLWRSELKNSPQQGWDSQSQ